ncbi:MAG TPA: hypothetical protein VIX12_08370, partial [Candidatus Binataceae bacterium]
MRVRQIAALVAAGALVSALYIGCGVKSPPIPPEDARPERILDLDAVSVPTGIELTWGRPERYSSGATLRDLGSFVVMRQSQGELQKIADVPVTDTQRFQVQREFSFIDKTAQIGQAYHYLVTARTTDGYESLSSNDASAVRVVPQPPPNPDTFV